MSAIYLAQQERPRRLVAIKALRPQLLADPRQWPLFLARFRREADATAALDHANIMPIYAFGEQDDLAYLVMPYLPDGSLATLLERQGPLPIAQTLSYVEQVASALDYAHQHGIIHRDVKPSNLLLHADGRLLLADFGIARPLDQRDLPEVAFAASGANDFEDSGLTVGGATLGTPDFMAPEQIRGERVGPAADIYALGVVTYAMLVGRSPFGGGPTAQVLARQLHEPPPPLRFGRPDAPARTEEAIFWALAKDPAERPPSAGAFAQALRDSVRGPLGALWKRAAAPGATLASFRGPAGMAGGAVGGLATPRAGLRPNPDATLWDPAYHMQEAAGALGSEIDTMGAAPPPLWRSDLVGGAGRGAGAAWPVRSNARGVSVAMVAASLVALVVLLIMAVVVANALGGSLGQAFFSGGPSAASHAPTVTPLPTATATPSPTPSPTPPVNWLSALPTSLSLSCQKAKKTQYVTLVNEGPTAVGWTAHAPGFGGVSVKPPSGTLEPQHSATIAVTDVAFLYSPQGQITFTPTDQDAGAPAVVSYTTQAC